jgi:chemotaxis protein CheZ
MAVISIESAKVIMVDGHQSRRFTAEIRRGKTLAGNSSANGPPISEDLANSRHRELLDALQTMERKITEVFARTPAAESESVSSAVVSVDPSTQLAEDKAAAAAAAKATEDRTMSALLTELQSLQTAIENTRSEIANLRQTNGARSAPLVTASDELDAVVQATESATESILAAAEYIDETIGKMRGQATSEDDTTGMDEIAEQVVKIFESCNFQDITGQRITKVVNAVKFVEEKVDRMIDNLGGVEKIEAAAVNAEPKPEAEADSVPLEGPQLQEENKVSQDDIDKLFG